MARVTGGVRGVGAAIARAIIGPGSEKTELLHHLQDTHPEMILRVQASDHPTDKEIIARGKAFFGFA
jgi:hypothetical protein